MRLSQFPVSTTKETPADAEIISHQLMLRAGLIRRLSSGLYSWMPIGLRVLQKVSAIVREEMNAAGCVELLMPSVHPAELWQESGRWNQMGSELLRMRDRHDRDFCYGPTHEEVICHHFRQDVRSYKQLPVTYYQIQTKFRDEIRPRFGVMRSREFLMKDAYSFHTGAASLSETYDRMRVAYQRIFERIGVDYRVVEADSGNIGGAKSEEFHVLAEAGEDLLAVSDSGNYAANIEAASTHAVPGKRAEPGDAMQQVETPGKKTIEAVARHLKVDPTDCVKTLIVMGVNDNPVALVLRGDHELNEVKAAKHPLVRQPLSFMAEDALKAQLGAGAGSIGPVGLNCPVIADHAAVACANFVCGANVDDMHRVHVNWGRDLPEPEAADLRNAVAGDPSPSGEGKLRMVRGIEVGHIFQLGSKYTEAMSISVLDADGKECTPQMGCYGVGVTRIVGAAIEQSHDGDGIVWPPAIAPFTALITPINLAKSEKTRIAAEALYKALTEAGFDVLLDDRGLRPGVMFADADLIGIPHRITIGERGLDKGIFEYKHRRDTDARDIAANADAVLDILRS
ncbi:proline--tRNA ligase [bacterium]|nr:proline--tRNA ligase [bacterium]